MHTLIILLVQLNNRDNDVGLADDLILLFIDFQRNCIMMINANCTNWTMQASVKTLVPTLGELLEAVKYIH